MKLFNSLMVIIFLIPLVTPTEAFAAMQSLDGLTGQNQTFTDDSNVTMTPSGSTHTLGWTGLLPLSRGGTGASSLTSGSVLFSNGTSISQDNSNLFWDNTNKRLGIGTNSPTTTLDVSGNAKINTVTVGLGGGSVSTNSTLGKDALLNNTTGARNTAIGYEALLLSNGFDNTAVGYGALAASISNTGSDENTAVGSSALGQNTTGRFNSAFGGHALNQNTTGSSNTALGLAALQYTTGDNNTAVGLYSLVSNTTGNNNVALGVEAGRRRADGSTLDTPENGVYLGTGVRGLDDNDNNSIVIGFEAVGAGANTAVLGNSSMTDVYFGSSSASANTHAKKMFLGNSTTPGCIVMGDTAGGVGYVTLTSGALTVSSTPPSACQ
jgi:trimeric autotransporter adhesin